MRTPIRLLIADSHQIVREGLRALLQAVPEIDLVGEAVDDWAAVHQARDLRPDVLTLDLSWPHADGLAVVRAVREAQPAARILVLTDVQADDTVLAAIKAGVAGYLLKDTHLEQLVQAIRAVSRGESFLHPTIARKLLDAMNRPSAPASAVQPLTEREVAVIQLVAAGCSNQQIGDYLGIGERTVASHVSNILAKLRLVSRTQAALYAIRAGLADPFAEPAPSY